jgi:hypothetical protein
MATVHRVEALRRHLNREGSIIRPSVVRVTFNGAEPFIVTLEPAAARDLAARLLAQANHAEAANRSPIAAAEAIRRVMVGRQSPAEHEARYDLAALELGG